MYTVFFLKTLKIWDFIAQTRRFFRKSVCLEFWTSKPQFFLKVRDSHLIELFNKYYVLCSFRTICLTNVFLTNFQTFIFFAPKSRQVTPQNRLYLKNCPNLIFWHQTTHNWCPKSHAKFMSISARVQELFRKNRGGGVISPPGGQGLREGTIIWEGKDKFLPFPSQLYSNQIPVNAVLYIRLAAAPATLHL